MESKVLFRTFIAIPVSIPQELINTLNHFRQEFSNERIRWVKPSNMHITLRFIGNISQAQVNAVKANFQDTYDAFGRSEFKLCGLGTFSHRSELQVLWAGIESDGIMRDLHAVTQGMLDEISTIGDQRAFRPHLTLARIKRLRIPARFKQEVDLYRTREFGICRLDEIVFYRSLTGPGGAAYEVLEKAELGEQD